MDQKQDDGVRKRQLKNTAAYAVAGGIVIAAILLITTIWVSNSARVGTDQAVNRVSGFYLEELAGRRHRWFRRS